MSSIKETARMTVWSLLIAEAIKLILLLIAVALCCSICRIHLRVQLLILLNKGLPTILFNFFRHVYFTLVVGRCAEVLDLEF